MNKKVFLTCAAFSLALLLSCSKNQGDTVTIIKHGQNTEYHINTFNIKDSLHLKLSDFAWDFEFIPLESKDGCMISYGTKDYFGRDYYLSERRGGDIYQFGRDGKFIRKIVRRGKGPTEFIDGKWTVDETNQILYLADRSKSDYFLRFDLKTGNYLGNIPKAVPGRTFNIEWTKDGSLMAVPTGRYVEEEFSDYIYYQDLNGKKISSIPAPKIPSFLYNPLSYAFTEDQYRLGISNNDTIFSVEDDQLIPYLTFDFGIENPSNRLEMGHIEVRIQNEVESWLDLDVATVNMVKKDQTGQVLDMTSRVSYWALDKKNAKAYHRGKLFIDPTNDDNGWWITFNNNGWFVKVYDAFKLLEKAEEAFKDPNFKEPYRSKLEAVTSQLSEEDNPVLLVGRYR